MAASAHTARVVIAMPAYRAAATLARTVADIPAGLEHELILVDDASPDDTVRVARDLGISVIVHPENRGYGGNQKTCYTEALRRGADIVVLLHPDYQYDPKAVPLLIAPILAGDADMTFGSRFAGLGDPRGGGMPMYRYVGNRVTTLLQNVLLGSRFTEMHSGMRAYTRDCLLSLPFRSYTDDFAFDGQMMVDAVTLGQRVVEVPIPTRYTIESSSIAIAPSVRYIWSSLAYCATQSARRGRRGRRSPVAALRTGGRLPPIRRVTDALPAANTRAFTEAALRSMQRFVVSGSTLAVDDPSAVALDLATAHGWTLATPDVRADAALVGTILRDTPDPVDALTTLRKSLADEALVAVASPRSHAALRALDASGFRLVDWIDDSAGAERGDALAIVRSR